MNDLSNPHSVVQWVLGGGFLIGIVLGAAAQASRFCTMGALADWFSFRGTSRLLMWVVAVAVAALLSQVLIAAGLFDATRSLAWSPRLLWVSYLVGGTLFGYGMVLASGCPQRNLVRAGSGNLKSLVTLLVAGVAAEMTLRGAFAVPRTELLDRWAVALDGPQDLGSVLASGVGAPASAMRWVALGVVIVVALGMAWRWRRTMEPMQWISAVLIGALVPLAYVLTGYIGFFAEHPETLEPAWVGTQSNRPEGLSFSAPLGHGMDLLTLWSDNQTTLSFGVAVVLGVWAGSFAMSVWRREFHVESFRTTEDLGNHLVGGVLMGFGGVTAMGCSIGQGVTGMAMLSTGACLATAGIVGGTWLALRMQERRMERLVMASA
jgi:uncharacterized membrane protein YedE/YeeE